MTLKTSLLIPTLILTTFCKAQTIDSIEAKTTYGSEVSDIRLLMELEKISYDKVFLKNFASNKYYFFLTSKQYWNGKLTKIDTLLSIEDAKRYFVPTNEDSIPAFSLITKPLKDSILFNYRFPRLSISRKYKRIDSDDYSLRDGIGSNEEYNKIPANQTIPLFAYSLPYSDPNRPGYKSYCALTATGVPPEKWWDKYKVMHYIVVEMKIITE